MPVSTKRWKEFLKSIGLIRKRTESSHEIWDMPDDSLARPVVVVTNKKEVPDLHIKTTLKNLGMTKKDFEDWNNK